MLNQPINLKYQFPHPLGALITINYLNFPEDTIDINSLNNLIFQADNFWKRYMPDIFKNSFINVWHNLRPDIPRNKLDSTGKIIDFGIGDCGGLSWAKDKRIDLNSLVTGTEAELKLAFYHEKGHELDYMMDLGNDPTDIIMPEYLRIADSDMEHMAEHFLELIMNYPYKRGTFKSIWEIQGLHDMFLIWYKVAQFVKSIKAYKGKVTTVTFEYSKTDFNFFRVFFHAEYPWQTYYYCCDRGGFQEWTASDNKWKFIAYF